MAAAEAQIKAVITADDRASKTIGGFGTKLGDLSVGAVAAGAAIVDLGRAAFDFGVTSVKAYEDSQDKLAQLNAVLKSTGGVAGWTAQNAIDLSKALQRTTKYSDESVLSVENLLLTFTDIGANIMPQATQAVLDMSTALGEDTKSASIQLGKALQDPILGITALRRVGVNFNDTQKEMVKGMVEAGNKAGAQAYIMAELNKEFGGSALAAGNTYAGSLEKMNNALNDMQESVGAALLPAIIIFANKLTEFVNSDKFKDWLEKLTAWIRDELPKFITKLFDEYIPKAKQAFEEWWPRIKFVIGVISDLITNIEKIGKAIEKFSSDVGLGMGIIILWFDDAKKGIEKFGASVYDGLVKIVNWFREKFDAIKSWVSQKLDEITSWFRSLPDSIANGLGSLFEKITKPFRDAFNWVKDQAGKVKDAVANALDPTKKHSPSLVDKVKSGTQVIKDEYSSLFNNIKGLPSDFKVADMAQPMPVQQPEQTLTSQQSVSNINITISSMYSSGSEQEKRTFAKEILTALKDVANQKNTSVTELMGA